METAKVQYVYLQFDGAVTDYVNEEAGVNIPEVVVQPSGISAEQRKILAEILNLTAPDGVVYVTDRPETEEYSTIFIGKTDAFSGLGEFIGLAENVDKGNVQHQDKAFVLMDSSASPDELVSAVAHETAHLTGNLDHDGEGMEKYALSAISALGSMTSSLLASNLRYQQTINSARQYYYAQQRAAQLEEYYSNLKYKNSNSSSYTNNSSSYTNNSSSYTNNSSSYTNNSSNSSAKTTVLIGATGKGVTGTQSDDWEDRKTLGESGTVGSAGKIIRSGDLISDSVGSSDPADYKSFTLASPASVSFKVYTDNAVKFSLCKLDGKSLKTLQSMSVKNDTKTTKSKLLEAGTYYICVKNAKSGKDVVSNYTVAVDDTTSFYTQANTGDDAWNDTSRSISSSQTSEWVGFGDAKDCFKVSFSQNGYYEFTLSGVTEKVSLTLYSVVSGTKVKKLKSVTCSAKKDSGSIRLSLDTSKEYVAVVEAKGASKGKNSYYDLSKTTIGTYHSDNQSFATAEKAYKGTSGTLLKGKDGDSCDYFDLSALSSLDLSASNGNMKVTFYDESQKKIKVIGTVGDSIFWAGSKVLKGGTSMNIASLSDSVRFMKLEAQSASKYCTYSFS